MVLLFSLFLLATCFVPCIEQAFLEPILSLVLDLVSGVIERNRKHALGLHELSVSSEDGPVLEK